MFTISIQDEQLANQLQAVARNENRPIEDVLRAMLADYPRSYAAEQGADGVKQARLKAYARARRYWESAGDSAKLSLSDAELDEQFAYFDEMDIPRLKSEVADIELQPGTSLYVAKIAAELDMPVAETAINEDFDEFLNREFTNYLMRGKRD